MTEDPVCVAAIDDIIARAGDHEAVGLLYRAPGEPEMVVALTNLSEMPQTSYKISTASLARAMQLMVGDQPVEEVDESHFVVWHSHPSRSSGPSRADVRSKLPGLRYAVVVRTVDGLEFTEF